MSHLSLLVSVLVSVVSVVLVGLVVVDVVVLAVPVGLLAVVVVGMSAECGHNFPPIPSPPTHSMIVSP